MFIPPEEMALRAALVRWTIAFPKSLKVHLREDKDITRVLQVLSWQVATDACAYRLHLRQPVGSTVVCVVHHG